DQVAVGSPPRVGIRVADALDDGVARRRKSTHTVHVIGTHYASAFESIRATSRCRGAESDGAFGVFLNTEERRNGEKRRQSDGLHDSEPRAPHLARLLNASSYPGALRFPPFLRSSV